MQKQTLMWLVCVKTMDDELCMPSMDDYTVDGKAIRCCNDDDILMLK